MTAWSSAVPGRDFAVDPRMPVDMADILLRAISIARSSQRLAQLAAGDNEHGEVGGGGCTQFGGDRLGRGE